MAPLVSIFYQTAHAKWEIPVHGFKGLHSPPPRRVRSRVVDRFSQDSASFYYVLRGLSKANAGLAQTANFQT